MSRMPQAIVKLLHFFTLVLLSFSAFSMSEDDPILTKVIIDQLEIRDTNDNKLYVFEGQTWTGKDINKLWIKADVEYHNNKTEELELQALYSRAVTPFWNIQGGIRHDSKSEPSRSWAVIGMQGLAPYLFEIDIAAFIDEEGKAALRVSTEYEILFTQRLVLTPEIEANFYAEDSPDYHEGSGLADIQVGLRLRYHIGRQFAPYLGINWQKQFGSTAGFSKNTGDDVDTTQWVFGVRAWF